MTRRIVVATAVAAFVAGCSSDAGDRPAAEAKKPSLVLITIDTLRADGLSCYGNPRPTSPSLDGFLASGTRFEHAFSTSCRTAPSHVSIMTGLYPSFTSVDVHNGIFPLDSGFVTLAELCREAGLATAAIVSNPVLSRRLGLDQGFDTYDDSFPDEVLNRPQMEKMAEHTTDVAVEMLRELAGDRFFLWVHYQDPHGPYTPPRAALDQFEPVSEGEGIVLEAGTDQSGYRSIPRYQVLGSERRLAEYERRYDAEIRYLDIEIARLLAAITPALSDGTFVVITSDHGEAFGEDEFYCAHGHALGPDQTRVPLGFVGPGIRPGGVIDAAVSNLDVFATAIEMLDLESDGTAQSESLWSSLRTGAEPADRVGYAESVTQRAAFAGGAYLRADRRPLTDRAFWEAHNPYTGAPRIPLGGEQLTEPAGASSVDLDLPVLLAQFGRRADEAVAELDTVRRAARPLSEKERRQLEALGYLK